MIAEPDKGPMAQVADDFGNVFRRGAVTAIAARDWDMLMSGPSRDAFLLLGPEETLPQTAGSCCGTAESARG